MPLLYPLHRRCRDQQPVSDLELGGAIDRSARPSDAICIMLGAKISVRDGLRRSSADNSVVRAQQQRVPGALNGFLALP